ncbi:MAG TPA: hypothetical protein VLB68_03130 [Pyrinomonadaceae bacterium]|nr:hypothetical protein [Pyrinomonadaceae bacterium]
MRIELPAFLVIVILTLSLIGCGNNRPFNNTKWIEGSLRDRGRMSEDLVNSNILIGATVGEAEQLLGPADFTYPTALQYKIDLGWPLKDPKHYGLQVHFDASRRVHTVKIVD